MHPILVVTTGATLLTVVGIAYGGTFLLRIATLVVGLVISGVAVIVAGVGNL